MHQEDAGNLAPDCVVGFLVEKSDLSFVREDVTEKLKVTRVFRSLRVFSGKWRKRCRRTVFRRSSGSRRSKGYVPFQWRQGPAEHVDRSGSRFAKGVV